MKITIKSVNDYTLFEWLIYRITEVNTILITTALLVISLVFYNYNRTYYIKLVQFYISVCIYVYFINLLFLGFIFYDKDWFILRGHLYLYANMLFVVTFAKIIFYFLFLFILVYLIYTLHNNQILTYFNNLETPWLCSVILYVILQIIYTSELTLFFLLIEVYSITTYILISLRMDSLITTEAGLKFFIVNSFSSIIILFGLFQLYYWLATLNMFEMLLLMQYWPNPNILFLNYNGFIIILVGLFFKLGIVPFHMWYIDTYDSTDFTILLFLSTAPKYGISLYLCSWFGFLHLDRSNIILDLIYICSFLSIFIGTFGGLFQLNIKRFFIYSSISHMGFMLTSLLLKWPLNIILFCMYIFVYILIYFCLLLAKMVAKDRTTNFIIKHIYNLHSIFISNRALTFSICSFLIILTSLPPFVLFYIKFLVLTTLIDHFEFLIVWALLVLNIVGAYIYIRITTHILFRKISDSCFVFLSIPNKYISFFISFMVFFNLFSFLNFPVFIFLLFVFIG